MFSVSFLVLFFNLATLHGEQDPMCAGRLQGRPPWSQTVSWDDASWVLLQTPPASTPALLQPVPWLHQQEHLHQACLGSNVPVCPSYTDSKLGEINCSLCLVRFTLIHFLFPSNPRHLNSSDMSSTSMWMRIALGSAVVAVLGFAVYRTVARLKWPTTSWV